MLKRYSYINGKSESNCSAKDANHRWGLVLMVVLHNSEIFWVNSGTAWCKTVEKWAFGYTLVHIGVPLWRNEGPGQESCGVQPENSRVHSSGRLIKHCVSFSEPKRQNWISSQIVKVSNLNKKSVCHASLVEVGIGGVRRAEAAQRENWFGGTAQLLNCSTARLLDCSTAPIRALSCSPPAPSTDCSYSSLEREICLEIVTVCDWGSKNRVR